MSMKGTSLFIVAFAFIVVIERSKRKGAEWAWGRQDLEYRYGNESLQSLRSGPPLRVSTVSWKPPSVLWICFVCSFKWWQRVSSFTTSYVKIQEKTLKIVPRWGHNNGCLKWPSANIWFLFISWGQVLQPCFKAWSCVLSWWPIRPC